MVINKKVLILALLMISFVFLASQVMSESFVTYCNVQYPLLNNFLWYSNVSGIINVSWNATSQCDLFEIKLAGPSFFNSNLTNIAGNGTRTYMWDTRDLQNGQGYRLEVWGRDSPNPTIWSVAGAGSLKINNTLPIITIKNSTIRTNNISGINHYSYLESISNKNQSLGINCNTGSTLGIGESSITCNSTDQANNTETKNFTITVIFAIDYNKTEAPTTTIEFNNIPNITNIVLRAIEYNETNLSTNGFLTTGKYYDITSNLTNGEFNATITFSYLDSDNDSIIDNTTINETEISVYYYNNQTSNWTSIPIINRDTENNTVTIKVDHFTQFSMMKTPPISSNPPAPSSSGGGGGGGGGGSGGGGSSSRNRSANITSNNSVINNSISNNQNSSQNNNTESEEANKAPITGAIVGTGTKIKRNLWLGTIIISLLAIGILIKSHSKSIKKKK
mgnify:CR=1 FL=1